MVIIVTGTSGTGKTAIAKKLAKKLKYDYLDVNKIIIENSLRGKYIKRLDSYEVDVNKLNKILVNLIKKNKKLVIDSHLSHYLPRKYVDYCVICKTKLGVLRKRLEKRNYSKSKVRENLDSEIFDVCLTEALENKHRIIIVDTSEKSIATCAREISKKIK